MSGKRVSESQLLIFFFSSRRRHTRFDCDWSSDVCSSDLLSKSQIPLIFVGGTMQPETVAEFITRGAYDCIEMGHIGHLPVAVHRALQEKEIGRASCRERG